MDDDDAARHRWNGDAAPADGENLDDLFRAVISPARLQASVIFSAASRWTADDTETMTTTQPCATFKALRWRWYSIARRSDKATLLFCILIRSNKTYEHAHKLTNRSLPTTILTSVIWLRRRTTAYEFVTISPFDCDYLLLVRSSLRCRYHACDGSFFSADCSRLNTYRRIF